MSRTEQLPQAGRALAVAEAAVEQGRRDSADAEHERDLLVDAVGEAARLLNCDGAMVYLLDPGSGELRFAYDAGVAQPGARELLRNLRLPVGQGLFGSALAREELVYTDDYPADERFRHHEIADRIVREVGLRSMAAAPMTANDQPLGVIGAFSSQIGAFSEEQLSLLRALAAHAAAAIGARRLLVELRRTLAARDALDEISRRIVDVDDPSEVFQEVVDVASSLLGSDGAHLTLMNDERTNLIPMVMAGKTGPDVRAWLRSRRFPVGGGINGLAAARRQVVWTEDYVNDPRLPHDPDDESVERLELGAVVVAPLLGPGGDVTGTLAITYREPRAIDPRDISLLDELARQASIAARNARLYAALRDRTHALEVSEHRYRQLVDQSPDLVWSANAEGSITYVGETIERLTGFAADAVIGRPWTILLSPGSHAVADAAWRAVAARPDEEHQIRVEAPLAGGGAMPAEINMIGTVVDGRFAGAHGSLRDITERERLEDDLRRRSAELAANEERANLARELHDSVTQALFSMGLTLRAAELLMDRDLGAAKAKMTELRELQNDALAEMRALIFELRPRGLEADGLAKAVENHATAVAGRTGLDIAVDARMDDRLPNDTEEALYRIAQEALHNVVKHANARSARIRLDRSPEGAVLTVQDDGAGFDPTLVSGAKLGLIGMRQRAELLGGEMEISSSPGSGTCVRVVLPLVPSAE